MPYLAGKFENVRPCEVGEANVVVLNNVEAKKLRRGRIKICVDLHQAVQVIYRSPSIFQKRGVVAALPKQKIQVADKMQSF